MQNNNLVVGQVFQFQGVPVEHNKPHLRMLFNPIFSDIKLVIGPNGPGQVEIPAHKVILATNSEFFKNMFNHQESPFKFPDAHPTPFRLFLMYVYSNDFGDLLKEPDMENLNVALLVLKYAKVYFVDPLVDLLISHINIKKTIANILTIICMYDQLDLKEKTTEIYEYARMNFLQVAQTEDWKILPRKIVQDFIDDSEITECEMEIFKVLKSWGEAQYSQDNVIGTDILGLRQVLEDLVKLIRYKRMSPKDFVTQIVPLKILTVEQEHKILVELTISNDRNESQNQRYNNLYQSNQFVGWGQPKASFNNFNTLVQQPKASLTRAPDKRILYTDSTPIF